MTKLAASALLGLVPLLATCANEPELKNTQAISTIEVALDPGRSTNVSFLAEPNSLCTISGQDIDSAPTIYGDSDGIVRLSLMFPDRANNASFEDMFLTCQTNSGEAVEHRLRFRHRDNSNMLESPLINTTGTATETDILRPGLSGGLRILTDAQIAALGYPPRPNSSKSPAA